MLHLKICSAEQKKQIVDEFILETHTTEKMWQDTILFELFVRNQMKLCIELLDLMDENCKQSVFRQGMLPVGTVRSFCLECIDQQRIDLLTICFKYTDVVYHVADIPKYLELFEHVESPTKWMVQILVEQEADERFHPFFSKLEWILQIMQCSHARSFTFHAWLKQAATFPWIQLLDELKFVPLHEDMIFFLKRHMPDPVWYCDECEWIRHTFFVGKSMLQLFLNSTDAETTEQSFEEATQAYTLICEQTDLLTLFIQMNHTENVDQKNLLILFHCIKKWDPQMCARILGEIFTHCNVCDTCSSYWANVCFDTFPYQQMNAICGSRTLFEQCVALKYDETYKRDAVIKFFVRLFPDILSTARNVSINIQVKYSATAVKDATYLMPHEFDLTKTVLQNNFNSWRYYAELLALTHEEQMDEFTKALHSSFYYLHPTLCSNVPDPICLDNVKDPFLKMDASTIPQYIKMVFLPLFLQSIVLSKGEQAVVLRLQPFVL